MNSLRIITLLLCLKCVIISAFGIKAEELISRRIEQNSTFHNADSIFNSPDQLVFYLSDPTIKGEWSIKILQNSGGYNIFTLEDSTDSFLTVNLSELDFWVAWNDAFRLYDENLNRDLFEMMISFKAADGREDSFPIKLGVLPNRPVIDNIKFTYSYDWENDMIYPNGSLTFDLHFNDASEAHFLTSQDHQFVPFYFFNYCEDIEITGNDMTWIYDAADWGEYFTVTAGNLFGWVSADILFTTDYIYDEDILERLKELNNNAGIKDISENSPINFNLNGYSINFNALVNDIRIFDINGRSVYYSACGDRINLNNINTGLYILTYKYNSKLYKNKIRL
ncbi:MAG: T9SS type A sorting domain-containing protein [Bacteroides sp.]|nr:T9SS type A sorting domain-containing protein [Bacteroides sp.]